MKITQVLDVKRFSMSDADRENKKAISGLETGQVLEVHTTDKGAKKAI
ncbi:hypothetical protein GCM10020331_093770 [Ectobacillus funiculus]